ncbi:hypothetical protein [Rubricoccus marinus]|uniref:Uncharacterized protein n=1 Tax=Rubricoccus marinus TaxID=716817 RepID=A0A259TUW9_9BACT|nr:hypothetical protein [Rubricoccus marinus]OZC01338.1 hypothetical protein BSZ36_18020 [Rubricoccus marinus]
MAYVSESEFVLVERSYDASHGAPGWTGTDDGRIGTRGHDGDTDSLSAHPIAEPHAAPAA